MEANRKGRAANSGYRYRTSKHGPNKQVAQYAIMKPEGMRSNETGLLFASQTKATRYSQTTVPEFIKAANPGIDSQK